MASALLVDITKCIGCGLCEEACKEANGLPEDVEPKLTASTWTVVENWKSDDTSVYVRRMCMHCDKPTCVSVCPVAAFEKTKEGPVIYHAERCIGCRYCMLACPFGVPKYEWHSVAPKVQKCIMCHGRLLNGEQPACAEVCPEGATIFGDREAMLAEANRRIHDDPDTYVNHIYGEKEIGGTNVLFLSGVNFGELGFRTDLGNDPLPLLTWYVLNKIPSLVSVSGVMLFGLWWIINRRMTLQRLRYEEEERQRAIQADGRQGALVEPEMEGSER